jgi:ABC-type transporter Mla subunit MlaD
MPKQGPSELKAGVFVLATLAILLAIVVWLGASKFFTPSQGQAWFYAEATAGPQGLASDYKVVINDVPVGEVDRVFLDQDMKRTYYVVNLTRPGIKIHSDAEVTIASSSMLGGSMLAVKTFGSPDKPLADEKNPVKLSGGMAAALNKAADTVERELDEANPKSMISQLKGTVSQLNTASTDIAAIAGYLKPEMDPKTKDSIAANLKSTMRNLSTMSSTIDHYVQDDLGKLIVKIRDIATVVLKTANNLDVTSEKIKLFMVANSPALDETMSNMLAVSANLKAASTEIRRNPWRLLYQPDKKEVDSVNLYDAARAFDDAATQLNTAVTKLAALRGQADDGAEAQEEIQTIRKTLMESFKKFRKAEEALWKELTETQKMPG